MRYELVVFDNDGVLVDSELIANRVLAACLTEAGHPTTRDESIRDFMGSAVHRVHELILERTGRLLPADFADTLHARTFAAFRAELEPVPGVTGVLETLEDDGVPYCLASSGSHERIRVSLHRTGLHRYFDEKRIFSSQDVGRGKPAPDLFLHAARTMGAPPERCAVVEDSPLGVEAGLDAGMGVYGYTALTPPERLAGALSRFSDMNSLLGLLNG